MASVQGSDLYHVESRFFHKVFVVFTGLAIISFLISLAGRKIGSEIAMGGHTDSLALHEIVIGNDVLSLPANMIRYPEQRRDGIAHRLDLYARWPNLSGFTRDSRPISTISTRMAADFHIVRATPDDT